MPITRVEIPKISERKLGYLARIIRPVVSYVALPTGRWPQDDVCTRFKKLPKNLREDNFLDERSLGLANVSMQYEIMTLHRPGSGGSYFHPTIAEVLAQIPEHLLEDRPLESKIIAFETYRPHRDPEWDVSGRFHTATTVLLVKARPKSKEWQRFHYS